MLTRTFLLSGGSDPLLTMRQLWQGPGDQQMRLDRASAARAMRLPDGPATLLVEVAGSQLVARAWGPGAGAALERAPALVGELDDPTPLVAQHPIIAALQRRLAGLRLTSGAPLIEVLLASIIGQKITSFEARRQLRDLIRQQGEPAPGSLGLTLPPAPEKLARLPYFAYHPAGIERRRADAIRAAADAAAGKRFDALRGLPTEERLRRLTALPGIGPWTAAEAVRLAFGDADAVSVGDYHLPALVCAALAGEPGGDDARMLELLEPYRGQRARVVLLLENAGLRRERHAPRRRARSIAGL